MNHKVYSLKEVNFENFEEVLVANSHFETVENLLQIGVKKEKIILCHINLVKEYIKKYNILDVKAHNVVITQTNPHRCAFNDEKLMLTFNDDYCRFGTLKLVLDEIKEVEGSFAELGVFQGDFSKYLNMTFPERKLYLFDTFEGFDERDIVGDKKESYASDDYFKNAKTLKNTSIELVMSKMTNPNNVIIRKGYFPETVPEEEISYAFVSLDCDLYKPTLAGLKYFYPRLVKGGYIMIHDYNCDEVKGIRAAVSEFEKLQAICKVPINDRFGSLIITK